MADIFISYASEDRSRVEPMAKALEEQGWTVWWDPQIPPGKTFFTVIKEALEAAKCVVVLWSNQSINSEWVLEEANFGKRRGILVPAKIDSVDPPLGFGLIQAADLTDWKTETGHAGFEGFLNVISGIVGPSPQRKKGDKVAEIPESTFEQQLEVQSEGGKAKREGQEENHRKEKVVLKRKSEEERKAKDDQKKKEFEEKRREEKAKIKPVELTENIILPPKPERLKLTKSKIVSATFLLLLLLFIGISLLSYSPYDPTTNNYEAAGRIQNLFGSAGAHISELLIGLFGIGAFCIPILLMLSYIHLFGKHSKREKFLALLGSIILVVITSSLLSMRQNYFVIFGNKLSAGGLVGIPIKSLLVKYTTTNGAAIVLVSIWFIGFILAGGLYLFTLIYKSFKLALTVIYKSFKLALTGIYKIFKLALTGIYKIFKLALTGIYKIFKLALTGIEWIKANYIN